MGGPGGTRGDGGLAGGRQRQQAGCRRGAQAESKSKNKSKTRGGQVGLGAGGTRRVLSGTVGTCVVVGLTEEMLT